MYSPNSEKKRALATPLKFRQKTQRNLPSHEEAIFRALIAARIPHFRHHFGHRPDALIFTQNLDNQHP